ncbi:hypothetical protein H257_00001 [Aphanomyces astaci]|uniref:Uncharacterized protein n=1 Tax=Aphanomyces astaci TaxID=112090 RepID=W4H8V7_APHAT|nr:hypothetical protein H257_00001 [Aphanomyces astaci]ETV88362.1 hypothetical protein H257_00001 [Aphanomyces astaci]|eukprot:XP_009820762.1 hypothetical protein H257_00001 [Aphanomyces astaci]
MVTAAGVLIVRLVRMKTSDEQGLSLYYDEKFLGCPRTTPLAKGAKRDASVPKSDVVRAKKSRGEAIMLSTLWFEWFTLVPHPWNQGNVGNRQHRSDMSCLLTSCDFSSKAGGACLKKLRELHCAGHLDTHIQRFDGLFRAGLVEDPSPLSSINQLRPLQLNASI